MLTYQTPDAHEADQVDAGLAALTGLMSLEGCFCYLGEPREGVIVLPFARQDLLAKDV